MQVMKPSPHPLLGEVSAENSSWFMVQTLKDSLTLGYSNELSTMNHEQGGFHPHPRVGEALSPPLVELPYGLALIVDKVVSWVFIPESRPEQPLPQPLPQPEQPQPTPSPLPPQHPYPRRQ